MKVQVNKENKLEYLLNQLEIQESEFGKVLSYNSLLNGGVSSVEDYLEKEKIDLESKDFDAGKIVMAIKENVY